MASKEGAYIILPISFKFFLQHEIQRQTSGSGSHRLQVAKSLMAVSMNRFTNVAKEGDRRQVEHLTT